jgi:hypothetical protein
VARTFDFQFGGSEQDKKLLAVNKTRESVFAYYLAHLRRHPECVDHEVFKRKEVPEYQFLQARTRIEIPTGEKKEERPEFHFGRIHEQRAETTIALDTSTVSDDLLDSATLYRFAIPVFPQGARHGVAAALNGSGVLCESLEDWLASTDDTNGESVYERSRAPRLAVICPREWRDAQRQLRPDPLSPQECLELGFLLSSCGVIVLYGDGGSQVFREYLRTNWKTWYERWVDERTLSQRMRLVEAPTEEDLKKNVKILLSYQQLKNALESAQRDFRQED